MSQPSVFAVSECEKVIKQLIESHGVNAVKTTLPTFKSLDLMDENVKVKLENRISDLEERIQDAASALGC